MSFPSGYDPYDRYYATRYRQGSRVVYSIDLSLHQVADLIPAPDPHRPAEGNRQVTESHARAFGAYVRENSGWVAPALILRAPDIFAFEVKEQIAGTEFGVLSFLKREVSDIRILDGQHRTLGIHYAMEDIAAELERERSNKAAALRTGSSPAVVKRFERRIEELGMQRARLDTDRVSIQIFIEEDQQAYKQMFFDIADNAKGITSSVKARFDNRKVVNRALEGVLKHTLLVGRVDHQQDRIAKNSEYLFGAKTVAEIVRIIAVGLDGRVGKRLEDELNESRLVEDTKEFLDCLVGSFTSVTDVVNGKQSASDFRSGSLLGSVVMLKVMAGVYFELVEKHKFTSADVGKFFQKLDPATRGPVAAGSIWVKYLPNNTFSVGALSPKFRQLELKTLRDTLVLWGLESPEWLSAANRG